VQHGTSPLLLTQVAIPSGKQWSHPRNCLLHPMPFLPHYNTVAGQSGPMLRPSRLQVPTAHYHFLLHPAPWPQVPTTIYRCPTFNIQQQLPSYHQLLHPPWPPVPTTNYYNQLLQPTNKYYSPKPSNIGAHQPAAKKETHLGPRSPLTVPDAGLALILRNSHTTVETVQLVACCAYACVHGFVRARCEPEAAAHNCCEQVVVYLCC